MRRRVVAFAVLMSLAGAGVAAADVSLTDQRQFADGLVTGGLAAGQVPRLIDATGLEWFINDEVTYATTSSAVGAASDAVFVGAVAATTSNGGTELSLLADAFDGYNALQVTVGSNAPVMYNNTGPATADCGGRQVLMPARTIGGLNVIRKVYVPATDGFARWLNVVTNPTATAQTVTLQMLSDLGSDAATTIGATSDGNATADLTDDWVTTYEGFVQGSSPSPRLAHVLQSPNSAVRLSGISFANGDDTPTWAYTFSVPAGGGVTVLNFAAGLASRPDAALKAAQLAALPPGTTACMTDGELATLANMRPGVVPTGPSPTGPASITITQPTADLTFAATTPFVSIGGTAGPAGLSGISWSSSRGLSGVAQGQSEWSIPSAAILPGTNVFTVTASYSAGVPISDTITITRGPLSYELPEGATGTFFSTDVLIANPNNAEVDAEVRFLKGDGTAITLPTQTLAPLSRVTIPLDTLPGLENVGAVSTVVSSPSGTPLVVERSMFWDATSYGSHGAASGEGPRKQFLFAEGSQGFFDTYLLLANSSSVATANATVTFLPENGLPVTRNYSLNPTTRLNVYAGGIPELVNQSFSMRVESDQPIVAERSMYFGTPLFSGGLDSPGVTVPATQWYFGEGATGGFFNTFFLLGNATPRAATAQFAYQLITGGSVTVSHTVPAFGRLTVNAALDDPQLANTAFALAVTSTEPVTAERSMYWSLASGAWYEGHNAPGVNGPGMKWGLAEGRVGTDRAFQTYILIGNTTSVASRVRVTFLRVGGGTIVKEYDVPANSRFNVDVNSMVTELANEEFGAIVEVLQGSPVIVERSLYNASGGVAFAAGTNTPAVRLP
jgi:hypothetical protein